MKSSPSKRRPLRRALWLLSSFVQLCEFCLTTKISPFAATILFGFGSVPAVLTSRNVGASVPYFESSYSTSGVGLSAATPITIARCMSIVSREARSGASDGQLRHRRYPPGELARMSLPLITGSTSKRSVSRR